MTDNTFTIDGRDHVIGDKDCLACWFDEALPCKCGGLVHTEFGDENYDGDYWLWYRCDKCGEDYEIDETAQP